MLIAEIPMALPSCANLREHWAKSAKRTASQRGLVKLVLRSHKPPRVPCSVVLTRVASRKLDDDNLGRAFKAVRDEVAAWIGVDDCPGSGIVWEYAQAKCARGYQGIRIEVSE